MLILGGGDGRVLSEVLKYPPNVVTHVTLVEIDPEVIVICQQYNPTRIPDSFVDVFELLIGDAMDYVKYTTDSFDAILIDIPDSYQGYLVEDGPMSSISFEPFMEGVSRILNKGGVVASLYTDDKGPWDIVPRYFGRAALWQEGYDDMFLLATNSETGDLRAPLRAAPADLCFYSHEKHCDGFMGPDYTEATKVDYFAWCESQKAAEDMITLEAAQLKVAQLREEAAEAEAELKALEKELQPEVAEENTAKKISGTAQAKDSCTSSVVVPEALLQVGRGWKPATDKPVTGGFEARFAAQSEYSQPLKNKTETVLKGVPLGSGGAFGSSWKSFNRPDAGQSDLAHSDSSRPGTTAQTHVSDTAKTVAAADNSASSRIQNLDRTRSYPYSSPPPAYKCDIFGRRMRGGSLDGSDSEGEQGGGVTGKMGAMNPPRAKKGANPF